MAKTKGRVSIDIEKCKGCELCLVACPEDSLEMSPQINGQGYHYVVQVRDTCTGCVSCALVCPDAVIKVYRSGTKSKRPVAVIQGVTRDLQVTVP